MKKENIRNNFMTLAVVLCLSMTCLSGCGHHQPLQESDAEADFAAETDYSVSSSYEDSDKDTDDGSDDSSITLVMVGDILLHTPVEESAKTEDGYDFSAIFAHTGEEIAAADLALVNEEVIIGGQELGISGYPAFNAPYEIADALADAGFDIICQATNHAMDKGKQGILNDLNYWKTTYPGIEVLGIHASQEDADRITVCDTGRAKIAFLNYTFGTNGISLPSDMPYAVDLLTEDQVISDIQRAEEEADFTVVCPHWGTEYRLTPDSSQKRWTQLFLENGVDLVIGTHPHVIEPIETLTDGDGHSMLVYYSLGNFVNWTSGNGAGVANRMAGGMARVTLTVKKDGVSIADYGVEPLVCQVQSGPNGVTVYRFADYTEELARQNEICKQDPEFSYEYLQNLFTEVWQGAF